MASTAASVPSAPIPIHGAHWSAHGQCHLWPSPSKSSGGGEFRVHTTVQSTMAIERENTLISGSANHGLYSRMWAVHTRSGWCRALIQSWATLPMTGAIQVKRGWWVHTVQLSMAIWEGKHPYFGHRQPWHPPALVGRPCPFQSMMCIDLVMGNAAYDWHHPNWAGGVSSYSTIKKLGNLRGKTPSFGAPPTMASTGPCGPSTPIPVNGAHWSGHGQRCLRLAPSKLSGGASTTIPCDNQLDKSHERSEMKGGGACPDAPCTCCRHLSL